MPCNMRGDTADDALPSGWQLATARSTGETYYYNTRNGESTFERPRLSAVEKLEQLQTEQTGLLQTLAERPDDLHCLARLRAVDHTMGDLLLVSKSAPPSGVLAHLNPCIVRSCPVAWVAQRLGAVIRLWGARLRGPQRCTGLRAAHLPPATGPGTQSKPRSPSPSRG